MTTSTGRQLYYLGKPGDGYGWGVANSNLVKALEKLCTVKLVDNDRNRFDAPVFVPLADDGLRPDRPVKAPRVLGYGFWEWPLKKAAAKINSERFHWIFAGSEWCANRVRQATGASHVSALIQGVDHSIFTPQPYTERKGFRVFSGGKWEYRKGQDIVLAAMKTFMALRRDVMLITSWNNPWPHTAKSMDQSPYIDNANPLDGLPEDRVINLAPLKNVDLPTFYAEADVGLFPNRCEGGTNMVMSEFMACGRPVIASAATGQADILGDYPFNLTQGSYDHAGWFHADVSDCLVQLERLYKNRALIAPAGSLAASKVAPYTWDRCAEQIVAKAF